MQELVLQVLKLVEVELMPDLQVQVPVEEVQVLVSDSFAHHLHRCLKLVGLVEWAFFHSHYHCWYQRNSETRTNLALGWSEECSVEKDSKHLRCSGLIP